MKKINNNKCVISGRQWGNLHDSGGHVGLMDTENPKSVGDFKLFFS